jgi:hypothetical protein
MLPTQPADVSLAALADRAAMQSRAHRGALTPQSSGFYTGVLQRREISSHKVVILYTRLSQPCEVLRVQPADVSSAAPADRMAMQSCAICGALEPAHAVRNHRNSLHKILPAMRDAVCSAYKHHVSSAALADHMHMAMQPCAHRGDLGAISAGWVLDRRAWC